VGVCAHVVTDIALDSWGYPILPQRPIEGSAAKAAVAACPRRALFLDEEPVALVSSGDESRPGRWRRRS
jgi:hypothetical protein